MVSTHLKNIRQNGNLPQIGDEHKKYLSCHHLAVFFPHEQLSYNDGRNQVHEHKDSHCLSQDSLKTHPKNRPKPKKEGLGNPTIHFSGAKKMVSFMGVKLPIEVGWLDLFYKQEVCSQTFGNISPT